MASLADSAAMENLHHRNHSESNVPAPNMGLGPRKTMEEGHPSGQKKHGQVVQILRMVAFVVYFFVCCIAIHLTQLIGAPLYWVNRELYYSYMALTKQSFALTTIVMTYLWGPTVIRISGDASVADQLRKTEDGRAEFNFPERMVLIANHQIYTDWLYLWWVGYANKPRLHGHIYIILKESLKYIPLIGGGMMFYGFIFMSRKMAVDQPRMAHRLRKLKTTHVGPGGKQYLDPMWLLLFPEGTNLSGNGRVKSAKWAEKIGVKDMEHMLLPRSTGIYYCLSELQGTVDYVYDCTVAYEGVPRGRHGEDYFTLSSTYFQGRPPKSVNFHWRRFRLADIPLDDQEKFDVWLRERWYEKDALMERYLSTGRFPPCEFGKKDYIETEVRTKHPWEILQVFSVLGSVALIWKTAVGVWHGVLETVGLR